MGIGLGACTQAAEHGTWNSMGPLFVNYFEFGSFFGPSSLCPAVDAVVKKGICR